MDGFLSFLRLEVRIRRPLFTSDGVCCFLSWIITDCIDLILQRLARRRVDDRHGAVRRFPRSPQLLRAAPLQPRVAAGAATPKLAAVCSPCLDRVAQHSVYLAWCWCCWRCGGGRACAGAGGAGFPFQIFLTVPLVILSIRSFETSWASWPSSAASTVLIEKIWLGRPGALFYCATGAYYDNAFCTVIGKWTPF